MQNTFAITTKFREVALPNEGRQVDLRGVDRGSIYIPAILFLILSERYTNVYYPYL